MQTAERPGFEEQIARLCTEYGEPATKARKDAYWMGLAKMSLTQLTRCIDIAIGAEGPDGLPTAKGLWKLYRQLLSLRGCGRPHAAAMNPITSSTWRTGCSTAI